MRAKHKSVHGHLNRSVRWLESLNEIKKVVLARCESCRHKYADGYIRCHSNTDAGLRIKGYSGNGVMDIFLVVDYVNQDKIKKLIGNKYG